MIPFNVIPAEGMPDRIVAGTTTRQGGVSGGPYASLNLGTGGGDDPAAVAENRRRLLDHTGGEPVWLRQVHGTSVVTGAPSGPMEADACIAREPGLTLHVLTADCLPILVAARDASAVAAIHAGWRGLAGGIVEQAIRQLAIASDRLVAWLGPAISRPHFEVGGEVREAFLARDASSDACFEPNASGRWQADLYAIATRQLRSLGIEEIHGGEHCTFGEPDLFFSYRRDGVTGRMASYITIR